MKNLSDHTHGHLAFTYYILFYMPFALSVIVHEAHKKSWEHLPSGMQTESRLDVFPRRVQVLL